MNDENDFFSDENDFFRDENDFLIKEGDQYIINPGPFIMVAPKHMIDIWITNYFDNIEKLKHYKKLKHYNKRPLFKFSKEYKEFNYIIKQTEIIKADLKSFYNALTDEDKLYYQLSTQIGDIIDL